MENGLGGGGLVGEFAKAAESKLECPVATGNCPRRDEGKSLSERARARCRYLATVETRCGSKVERYLLRFLHPERGDPTAVAIQSFSESAGC